MLLICSDSHSRVDKSDRKSSVIYTFQQHLKCPAEVWLSSIFSCCVLVSTGLLIVSSLQSFARFISGGWSLGAKQIVSG